jgi:hypothetical protein
VAAIGLYLLFSVLVAILGLQQGRWFGLVAVALTPLAYLWKDRPLRMAVTLIAGGIVLRLTFLGLLDADGLAISQGALQAVLGGGNPYGHGYEVSIPPGAPFVYGPLALLTSVPGPWVELAAGIGTMALMAWLRSWIALAVYAAAPLVTTMTMSGTNDVLPGLLIAGGLLALRERPIVAALLLACAAAIKPYALAWYPGLVALGGLGSTVVLVITTAALWSPLLMWGPATFLQSVEMARDFHQTQENALDLPGLRVLAAIPFVLGFFSRSWLAAVLLGTAVFVIVLYFDRWASISYWLAVAPILLIAGEETIQKMWARRGAALQATSPTA